MGKWRSFISNNYSRIPFHVTAGKFIDIPPPFLFSFNALNPVIHVLFPLIAAQGYSILQLFLKVDSLITNALAVLRYLFVLWESFTYFKHSPIALVFEPTATKSHVE